MLSVCVIDSVCVCVQLIVVQQQLKQEGELIDSLGKLSLLREQGGEKAGKSGAGSGGLKNTLKRMKPAGKKKRQRNVTAPEITAEALKGLGKEQSGKQAKDGRGLFGKKKKEEEREGGSPRKTEQEGARDSAIKEEETDQEPPPTPAGERPVSVSRLSEYTPDPPAPPTPTLTHSKTDPAISLQLQPDLSQHSLSSSIPEEAASTQSSLEGMVLEQLAPPTNREVGSAEGASQEGKEEEEKEERDFRKGYPELYDDYGDEQHKMNLKHVLKFLETCSESSPVDLSCLTDWDGWTLVSNEVM